MRTQHIK